MINYNNFNTVEVKVALQGARKEVIHFEEMLSDDFEWNYLERTKIREARDVWIKTVSDLNTYLNSKLCK